MTVKCQACKAQSQLHLCGDCVGFLEEALESLPWLLEELDITRTRQDRLTTGGVGKSAATPSPINVGAMELNREVVEMLADWTALVETLGPKFLPALAVSTGFVGPLRPGWRRLPRGYAATPSQRARWLSRHVGVMAKHPKAGQFYEDVTDLAGNPAKPDKKGRLLLAINRTNRIFAGPCPSTVGYNFAGEPVECGVILWAVVDEPHVECPKCKQAIDVAKNRMKAAVDRDLLPEVKLLETLDTLGEKVSRVRLYEWLKAKRLHHRGYAHQGRIVAAPVRRSDPRVFSLSQCRQLRWQDEAKTM